MSTLLIAVGQHRDRAAFEALFRHYAPRVKSYLLRFGGASHDVDEVLQETFATIWRKAHLYDAEKAMASTWIFTIARNQRVTAFRREKRPELDPNDPALVPAPEPDGETVFSREEERQRVSDAMSELNENQRRILYMSFFEERTHEHIARELGVPIGTVKSRIRLAYGHLRNRLERALGDKP